ARRSRQGSRCRSTGRLAIAGPGETTRLHRLAGGFHPAASAKHVVSVCLTREQAGRPCADQPVTDGGGCAAADSGSISTAYDVIAMICSPRVLVDVAAGDGGDAVRTAIAR